MTWVTAYTDASVRGGNAGWATWIISQDEEKLFSGTCPNDIKDSVGAELYAIYASLTQISKNYKKAEGAVIYSDCTGALLFADPGRALHRKEAFKTLQKGIRSLLERHRLRIKLRWIKGHNNSGGRKTFINNYCDALAREATHAC